MILSGNDYGRITAEQMTGVYAVLLGGIVVAGATLILEVVWKHQQIKRVHRIRKIDTEAHSKRPYVLFKLQMFTSSFTNLISR